MLASAKLVWATPSGDQIIAQLARVSSPENQNNHATAPRLIRYLIDHHHWSPFEMASMCVEVETTRDIGRQLLRHRSFSFQEFSGRYAAYEELNFDRELRGQDPRNRQNSVIYDEEDEAHGTILRNWAHVVRRVGEEAKAAYDAILQRGGAKECARALLPEGLVPTKMYVNGTVRSWIHYVNERTALGVQREHRVLALQIAELLAQEFPMVCEAMSMMSPDQRKIADLEGQSLMRGEALIRAHDTFKRYAELHEAKGTPESAEKAKVNRDLALAMAEALEGIA